jgi:hypothetical protein
MALNLTRGGLSPAIIKNTITNEEVKFMFNPFEYTITKNNSWSQQDRKGLNVPLVNFQQGGPRTLKLTLHFDSQASGGDVRGYTAPLWTMMMIDESTTNQSTGKSQPPPVMFEWGRLTFKAIITNMSEKFTLFTPNGTPLRCQVDISLQQYVDESEVPPQVPGATSSSSSSTTTVTEGDRLDNVAANSTGDPNSQRQIAEDNNIDNPQNIPPGTNLTVRR